MMGETFPEQTHDEQHYDLCRYLYRLHFQVLLFMENSAKLVNALQNVATAHEVYTLEENLLTTDDYGCFSFAFVYRCWTCHQTSV